MEVQASTENPDKTRNKTNNTNRFFMTGTYKVNTFFPNKVKEKSDSQQKLTQDEKSFFGYLFFYNMIEISLKYTEASFQSVLLMPNHHLFNS